MIPKALVLCLFLVSPLRGPVLCTLDLCLTSTSASSNSFSEPLRKPRPGFNEGLLTHKQPCDRSQLLERKFQILLETMPELVGSLSPVKEQHFRQHRDLIKLVWLGRFPQHLLSARQHVAAVGPFSECSANISISQCWTNHQESQFLPDGQMDAGSGVSSGGQTF